MKGKFIKDEDSGSDWDSMSEMEVLPKQSTSHMTHKEMPAAAPRKNISMTFVDKNMDEEQTTLKKQNEENPPYDFKSEVTSPRNPPYEPTKPGKPQKGKMYNVTTGEKRVSFDDDVDQEEDDPLYSTVKPKYKREKVIVDTSEGDSKPSPVKGKVKSPEVNKSKGLKSALKAEQNKALKGILNEGFIDDDANSQPQSIETQISPRTPPKPAIVGSPVQVIRSSPNHIPSVSTFQMATPVPASQRGSPSTVITNYAHSQPQVQATNFSRNPQTSLPPLILSTQSFDMVVAGNKPIENINRALSETFAIITFPFTCFVLFMHHLFRFLLLGLLKPLVIDTVTLLVEYTLHPCVVGVVNPILSNIYLVSLHISDIFLVCIKPVIALLKSFRLVEVNYTRKYSVDDV
ncbi:uncharacterized protein LOC143019500 isoform X2 [Oratosquilla oratoria]|uniref:uncharacterized protein LOC143019500 isoform X2 n=1 Tax=Oratosquilla oratoria TaxID=337810 RepID=UPI003F757564